MVAKVVTNILGARPPVLNERALLSIDNKSKINNWEGRMDGKRSNGKFMYGIWSHQR